MSNDSNITNAENEKQSTQAPSQELAESELGKAVGGTAATTTSGVASMRHEMLKAVAQNIRA